MASQPPSCWAQWAMPWGPQRCLQDGGLQGRFRVYLEDFRLRDLRVTRLCGVRADSFFVGAQDYEEFGLGSSGCFYKGFGLTRVF